MKTTTRKNLLFQGTVSGVIRERPGLGVRMGANVCFDQDFDGTWCIYVNFDESGDGCSNTLQVNDPKAAEAIDALIEMLADPVEFEGRSIEADSVQEVA